MKLTIPTDCVGKVNQAMKSAGYGHGFDTGLRLITPMPSMVLEWNHEQLDAKKNILGWLNSCPEIHDVR